MTTEEKKEKLIRSMIQSLGCVWVFGFILPIWIMDGNLIAITICIVFVIAAYYSITETYRVAMETPED